MRIARGYRLLDLGVQPPYLTDLSDKGPPKTSGAAWAHGGTLTLAGNHAASATSALGNSRRRPSFHSPLIRNLPCRRPPVFFPKTLAATASLSYTPTRAYPTQCEGSVQKRIGSFSTNTSTQTLERISFLGRLSSASQGQKTSKIDGILHPIPFWSMLTLCSTLGSPLASDSLIRSSSTAELCRMPQDLR